ncbi:MAG: winged helix-turn-helix transcriptional regulator [Rhodospirillales bacterium]
MNSFDEKIIQCLADDGRITVNEISERNKPEPNTGDSQA